MHCNECGSIGIGRACLIYNFHAHTITIHIMSINWAKVRGPHSDQHSKVLMEVKIVSRCMCTVGVN